MKMLVTVKMNVPPASITKYLVPHLILFVDVSLLISNFLTYKDAASGSSAIERWSESASLISPP